MVQRWTLIWTLIWTRIWKLIGIAIATLCLTGCAQYDVDLRFDHANHGVLTQQIHLSEQVAGFSDDPAQLWLQTIKQQARQAGGRVRRLSAQDIEIRLPFNNGADLETKFNQLFQFASPTTKTAEVAAFLSDTSPSSPTSSSGSLGLDAISRSLPQVQSHLRLQQNNFLVVVRNHLTYDLDLSSLGVRSDTGSLLFRPGAILRLALHIDTPWPLQVIDTGDTQVPVPQRQPGESGWTWIPLPGQQNHLELIFWLPSPIGIGGIAIALLVILGNLLRPIFSAPAPAPVPVRTSSQDPNS
jgi:hypothetical protein